MPAVPTSNSLSSYRIFLFPLSYGPSFHPVFIPDFPLVPQDYPLHIPSFAMIWTDRFIPLQSTPVLSQTLLGGEASKEFTHVLSLEYVDWAYLK